MKHFLLQAWLMGVAVTVAVPSAPASIFSNQQAKAYAHPDLEGGKIKIRSVLILPPQVEVKKSGVKSNEPMMDEARRVEDALQQIITRVLQEHGCQALDNPFGQEALAHNTDLKYTLGDLQKQFDTLDEQLSRKPKDVRKGRFTMGDEVNKLNPGGAADVLVFTRGRGLLQTGGKRALTALARSGGGQVFAAHIVVVDARTGSVLYYADVWDWRPERVVQDPERLTAPISKAFQDLPVAKNGM